MAFVNHHQVAGETDITFWEVVNSCDAAYSDDSYSVNSLDSDLDVTPPQSVSCSTTPPPLPPHVKINLWYQDLDNYHLLVHDSGFQYGSYDRDEEIDEGDENANVDQDDDPDSDDGYDVDDDLVPRSAYGKLGSQRMKKVGKKAFTKVHNSNLSMYSHVKPGCPGGKLSLGHKSKRR